MIQGALLSDSQEHFHLVAFTLKDKMTGPSAVTGDLEDAGEKIIWLKKNDTGRQVHFLNALELVNGYRGIFSKSQAISRILSD